jgi:O-antigen/teichoic acid export membrane protein
VRKSIELLFGHLLKGNKEATLSGRLVKGGVGSFALKVAATGLGFVVAATLARTLNAADFGIYSYVYALVVLMAMPAEFGLSALVVRETAKADVRSDWGLMLGVWRWATRAVGFLAGGFAVIGCVVAWIFAERIGAAELATFAWGLLLVPMMALGNLRGAALQGLRHVVAGQLPEVVLRPTFFLALLAIFMLLLDRHRTLTSEISMGLHVLAAAMSFGVGAYLLIRARPAGLVACRNPTYETRAWLTSTIPLALMGGMLIVNQQVGIIVLGMFRPVEEVGIYKIVMQTGMLTIFGMQAVNTVVGPHFSRLHSQGDKVRLQALARMSARVSLLFALPVLIVCVIWGEWLLGFVFGSRFAEGYVALVILAAGYCFSVAAGLANLLLNMTGHERDTAHGVFVAVIVNAALTLALTPTWGMNGAAAAAAASLIVWKVQLWIAAKRRLGLQTAAITFGRKG